MCYAGQTITEHLDAMEKLAIAMELERIRPDVPCTMCKPNDPCWWHRPTQKPQQG
jgi:hypothetical protein